METKARYVLVGFFTLLGLAISFSLLMFSLNKGDRDKVAYYATVFTGGVAGLSQGNDVRFNGIKVGTVHSFTIDQEDPSRVRVVLALREGTPIREDSEASLNIQGLTGLAVVDITGGSASSPQIPPGTEDEMQLIASKRSPLSSFVNEIPGMVHKATGLIERGNEVLSPENQENVANILQSLAAVSESLKLQSGNIELTIANLASISSNLDKLLIKIDTLVSGDLSSGVAQFNAAFIGLRGMIDDAQPGVKRITGNSADELQRLLNDAQILVRNMNTMVNSINSDPQRFLFGNNLPAHSIK